MVDVEVGPDAEGARLVVEEQHGCDVTGAHEREPEGLDAVVDVGATRCGVLQHGRVEVFAPGWVEPVERPRVLAQHVLVASE